MRVGSQGWGGPLGQGVERKEPRSLGLLDGDLGLLRINLGNRAKISPKC